MRFPMIPLLLAGLCAGLPLALGQRGTNCVPTKAQVILREKMAELDASKTSPPAARPAQPALSPEQETKAREALQQKLTEKSAPAPVPAAAPAEPVKPAPVVPVAVTAAPTPTPPPQVATPVSRTGLTADQEAKAREALRQQMEAMQPATPAPAAVQTAPAAAPAPRPMPTPVVVAPAPQPAPAVAAPAVVAPVVVAPSPAPPSTTPPPVVAATGLTPEQEAKARQALRQKMEVLGPVTPPPATVQTAPTPAPTPAPAPRPTPVPVVVAPAPQPAPVVAAPPEVELPALTAEQEALARESLRRKMAELDAAMAVAEVEPVPAPVPPVAVFPRPITPVALPPSQKQGLERLAELTEQYRAGLVTPLAYHQERAKIIQSLR
jgi:hypothetical protein